jgi:hypothetical protein
MRSGAELHDHPHPHTTDRFTDPEFLFFSPLVILPDSLSLYYQIFMTKSNKAVLAKWILGQL